MARKHVINPHTGTGTTPPSGASLYLGEIAVQHTPNSPALWFKMGTSQESNVYEKFIGETEILNLFNSDIILGEDYTYSGIPYINSATTLAEAVSAITKEVIDGIIENDELVANILENFDIRIEENKILGSGYTYSGIPYVNSATTIADAYSALTKEMIDDEYVYARAINHLESQISELSGNTGGGADVEALSGVVIDLSGSIVSLSAGTTGISQSLVNLSGSVVAIPGNITNLSGSVVNLSGATTGISQGLNSLSSATVTLSGAAHTKITNVSGAVVSLSASVVSNNQNINTVSGIVESLSGAVEDTITGVTLNGSSATVTNRVAALTSSTIYAGTQMPSQSLGNNGDVYLQADSVVLYETDGTTGLLGINNTGLTNNWQLEDMDFTPYRYIKCYFKAAATGDTSTYTPAVVVTVPLDDAAMGGINAYLGGVMVALPFNTNREYLVGCAVDSTKTKFQVVHQNTLWDITASDANNTGRYLYKIEGYI